VRPESREQILPYGLLIAGIVCGGISWVLRGTIFWVMVAVSAVLIIAGVLVASRTESARRK